MRKIKIKNSIQLRIHTDIQKLPCIKLLSEINIYVISFFNRYAFASALNIFVEEVHPILFAFRFPEKLPCVTRDAERALLSVLVDAKSHQTAKITIPRYQGKI